MLVLRFVAFLPVKLAPFIHCLGMVCTHRNPSVVSLGPALCAFGVHRGTAFLFAECTPNESTSSREGEASVRSHCMLRYYFDSPLRAGSGRSRNSRSPVSVRSDPKCSLLGAYGAILVLI